MVRVMSDCVVRVLLFSFLLTFIQPLCSWGSDLDDGISKYTDGSIAKWDELGKRDRNVEYIKLRAESKAEVKMRAKMRRSKNALAKDNNSQKSESGGGSINSVLIGAGGVVKGDIIIIDESRGDKTLISD